jgi:hypothetical protein
MRSPLTTQLKQKRIINMLTLDRPLHSTTVTIDRHPNGFGVQLAGNHIGTFDDNPVWGLSGSQYDSARALGLEDVDDCYVYGNQVFITQAQAIAHIVGDHLAATATWTMPDYM